MANNPLIPLMGKGLDVGQAFNNALLNVQGFDAIRQRRAEAERQKQLQPLKMRQAQAQTAAQEQAVTPQGQVMRDREFARLNSTADLSQYVLPKLKAGDIEGVRSDLMRRRQAIIQAQANGQDIDTEETDEALQLLDTNPGLLAQRAEQLIQARNRVMAGVRSPVNMQKGASFLVNTPEGPAISTNIIDPSTGKQRIESTQFGKDVVPVSRMGETAAEIEARKIREARGTAEARADVDLATKPQIESAVAAAQEGAKLKQQLKLKPRIQKAITEATRQATVKGEAITELDKMNAALPELRSSVEQLKKLAPLATDTLVGKGFNVIVQELGFGATTGKTARDRFISIMRNQILPMLKPTFGGIVSDSERTALMETMADPDAPPETKIATLTDFLDRKEKQALNKAKEVETLGGKASQTQGGTQPDIQDLVNKYAPVQ